MSAETTNDAETADSLDTCLSGAPFPSEEPPAPAVLSPGSPPPPPIALPPLDEAPPAPAPLAFDIRTASPLSFAGLEEGRAGVFTSLPARRRFREIVAGMSTAGDEGRRRGLGWWILGEYARAAEELAAHEGDDTAAFTRGKALLALRRYEEAAVIFGRLTQAYPQEPRPRHAWLEARLEAALARPGVDEEALSESIAGEIASAPADFADSPEGHYVTARVAELRRDWESALDHYATGRTLGSHDHALLSRFAHLAERCGFDELAIEVYQDLLRHGPMDRGAMLNLGVLYEDVGRDTDAAAIYDTVSQNDGTDTVARLYLSDAHAAIDMYYDEDQEKKEDRLNQILRIPITDFELSVRARNCLNKMQISTLGDLVQRTEQELLSYKNFGETSLTEIKEILHSKGLRLGMPREEAVASIEAHAARVLSGDMSDVMNKPILELQLSIRARRTVETLGCLTVGDIVKHSAEELLGMPNFGQTSLMELRNKLAELGQKLKGE
ncbi:MAG: DNA-directed RNA polymerase subunit alpha C-terminal domain-containing protein [Planctomycetota bacterium]